MSKEPAVTKPEAVTAVAPDKAPLVSVAVPSVILPPVTAPEEVTLVNPPVAGVTAPITVPLIMPPEIVRSSATYVSATAVPCQEPALTVPTSSISSSFPVVIMIPLEFGITITSSDAGSCT